MGRRIGKVLVVGAGISGIRAALDLAEFGYSVTLIDRAPHLGGILSRLDYQFPTDGCGMCKMLPLVNRDAGSQYCLRKGLFHENIEIMLSTEMISVAGEPGKYQVQLRQRPTSVDRDHCAGCGACADACPVAVDDYFNAGLTQRKAIYLPLPHNLPNAYVIDFAACTRCGSCVEVCPTGAIQLPEQERRGFQILIVDDELVVRDSLREWLLEEGFSVDMAASGTEALDRLAGQTFQLMLLDIKMPGMDGVEVLQRARENQPDLDVIMMTAYATVETAVEAMKIGARDYLVKPFDPETMIPMIVGIYRDLAASEDLQIEAGAIVICGGTDFFEPVGGKNLFGYGVFPNVVTSLEFERMLSGTGPFQGRPVRPLDGKPIRKVAWIQCVGSRDLQTDADFCSAVCCMVAIKEASLAKKKINPALQATIYYMDMRTYGKGADRYRQMAEDVDGISLERGRIHSVDQDAGSGDLIIRSVNLTGDIQEARFDLVILTVGQRPALGMPELAEMLGLELNIHGFGQTEPFSTTCTGRNGIVLGGSFTGLKDISESVIQASAAALNASRVIHAAGGSLALDAPQRSMSAEVMRQVPKILVIICTCGLNPTEIGDPQEIARQLKLDPVVVRVEFIDYACTDNGWGSLAEMIITAVPNRVLIGACLPYLFQRKIKELSRQLSLDPGLLEVVDIKSEVQRGTVQNDMGIAASKSSDFTAGHFLSALEMGIAKLKWVDPGPVGTVPVIQSALVIGGGIAGMTAALAIADHGFEVDLVEESEHLGGNLIWLQQTLEGHSTDTLLEESRSRVEKHPKIRVHTHTRVIDSIGEVGRFYTTVESLDGEPRVLEHGVTILATGGREAVTSSYGHGTSPSVLTQQELALKLAGGAIDPGRLHTVVMIQCVDSREEPRNYCSRVCCATALKHALDFKKINPELSIYILYRDMMTYGFAETYYTRSRKEGVIFIQYRLDDRPRVQISKAGPEVTVTEPIVGRRLRIESDLVVLATGVVSNLSKNMAQKFGADVDRDGFFQEADIKWRPVDALKEGVFACGLNYSPRNILETIATAEAASQRALRILSRRQLPAGKVVAKVHHSLCSLCERCIAACPYGARTIDFDKEELRINPAMCQGCGACAAVCPNSASIVEGFLQQQMLEMIDAALGC